MKRIKKYILFGILGIILLIGLGIFLYNFLVDENSLSIKEKKWIDENISNILSLNVPNDIPVFGNSGSGVFFDYIKYLETDAKLNINSNTLSYNTNIKEYGFLITNDYKSDNLLLYKDHYVLVSKNTGIINDNETIRGLTVGVLSNDASKIMSYYEYPNESVKTYNSYSEITENLSNGTITYAIVSLTEYKEELVKNNINILYHISDLAKYYYLLLGNDKMINSILTKEFNKWLKNEFYTSYNKNNYDLFVKNLGISSSEEDLLRSKVYNYGFVERRPYEILSGTSYGGITAEYLKKFTDFSGVEFNIRRYKNSKDLVDAAINNKIDLYYNYYNLASNYVDIGSLAPINYYIVAHNKVDLSLSDIYGLAYKTVYVLGNSYLYNLIKDVEGIELKTFDNTEELKDTLNKNCIVLVDANTYDYYLTNMTNDFSVRYKGTINGKTFSFRYENDKDTFFRLFNSYTKTLDSKDLLRTGMIEYNRISKRGAIMFKIAEYILIILVVLVIIFIFLKKKDHVAKLDTKVKKEDRLKYIDLLTSLKNRNYYNEKLSIWNKNKIYPQTCIVLDLNNVKSINDRFGHVEGDKQIVAVANILIKTQIDNTEIIRTDGNEFLIYMVNYSEKQVVSYINKLRKKFERELPYKYDVAFGFSMILDDTKLIEDAFNEASIQMRSNKELNEGEDEKKVEEIK